MVILNTSYEKGKARIELNSEELALIVLALKSQEAGKQQSALSNNFLMVSALVETGRISNIGNSNAIVRKTTLPAPELRLADKDVKEVSDPAISLMCDPDPEPFYKKSKKEII